LKNSVFHLQRLKKVKIVRINPIIPINAIKSIRGNIIQPDMDNTERKNKRSNDLADPAGQKTGSSSFTSLKLYSPDNLQTDHYHNLFDLIDVHAGRLLPATIITKKTGNLSFHQTILHKNPQHSNTQKKPFQQ
jgi:hypothetical protein